MNFTYIYSGDEYQQLRYEMMLWNSGDSIPISKISSE